MIDPATSPQNTNRKYAFETFNEHIIFPQKKRPNMASGNKEHKNKYMHQTYHIKNKKGIEHILV